MNIFEIIEKRTKGIEKYHSQFLADALEHSLNGNRSLFDSVWKLVTPCWKIPDRATVLTEVGLTSGRIDICIRSDHPQKRIVGIEIKTREYSAKRGQLDNYHDVLRQKFPKHTLQISYLTPFNKERVGETADRLLSVQEFKGFVSAHPDARHVSWLDVAEIPWDSNELWKQHQAYVRKRISSPEKLESRMNREFAHFFGENRNELFRDELSGLGIRLTEDGAEINLSVVNNNLPSFAERLVKAFEVLLDSDKVNRNVNRTDKFSTEHRRRYLDSPYHEVHRALFGLSERLPHVWVEGECGYGVRTAHQIPKSGELSLVTSRSPDRLETGKPR